MAGVLIGATIGAAYGILTNGITYAVTTPNKSWSGFGASIAKGGVGGFLTGACLGTGVGLLEASACGAAGGFFGDLASQGIEKLVNKDYNFNSPELGLEVAEGAASGLLGNIGAKQINRGWLALTNSKYGSLSAQNLLPWATTGTLGQRVQYNSLLEGLWGMDLTLGVKNVRLYNSARCSY